MLPITPDFTGHRSSSRYISNMGQIVDDKKDDVDNVIIELRDMLEFVTVLD